MPREPRAALTCIFLLRGFIVGSWFARVPGIAKHLDVPESQLGLVWLLLSASCIISFSVAAKIMARWGSNRTVQFVAVPYALMYAVGCMMPSVIPFAIMMIVVGFIGGTIDVACSVQGGIIERSTHRPLMSTLFGCFSLGALVGSFSAGFIAQLDVPLAIHFGALSAIALPSLIYLAWKLPADDPRQHTVAKKQSRRLRLSLPPKAVLPLGAVLFCVAIAEDGINNWVALYMRQDLDIAPAAAAFTYTAFCVATFCGRMLTERLVNRLGIDRVLALGAALGSTGILIAIGINTVWSMWIGYALLGLGLASIVPIIYRLAGELPNIRPADGVANVATICFLGFMFGPVLTGFLADLVSLRVALGLMAIVLLGIPALVMMQRDRPSSTPPASEPVTPAPEPNPASL